MAYLQTGRLEFVLARYGRQLKHRATNCSPVSERQDSGPKGRKYTSIEGRRPFLAFVASGEITISFHFTVRKFMGLFKCLISPGLQSVGVHVEMTATWVYQNKCLVCTKLSDFPCVDCCPLASG